MLQTAMPSSERGGTFTTAALSGSSPPPAPTAGGAFAQQTAALRPVVRAVVACVLGERQDHADVEDCTHEALRRALEGRARLRDGEPVRPWLLGIARHVAIDARRKRRRERSLDAPAGAEDETETWADQLADPSAPPDERAATTERARRISSALEGLAAPQREAMLLFHVEGEAYQTIADRLGVPIGTVATWLSRGRRTLAEALADPSSQRPGARET